MNTPRSASATEPSRCFVPRRGDLARGGRHASAVTTEVRGGAEGWADSADRGGTFGARVHGASPPIADGVEDRGRDRHGQRGHKDDDNGDEIRDHFSHFLCGVARSGPGG